MVQPAEAGDEKISFVTFAAEVTGMTDVSILNTTDLAMALATPFSDGEIDSAQISIEDDELQEQYDAARRREDLPDGLDSFPAFAGRYRALLRELPGRLGQLMDQARDQDRWTIAQSVASGLATLVAERFIRIDDTAGVQVSRGPNGALQARMLPGFNVQLPEQKTGLVAELGAGVAGGVRRVREVKEDVWPGGAFLLNRVRFASSVADSVAARLGVDSLIRAGWDGMVNGVRDLTNDGVQCDVVIVSNVSTTADPGELQTAIKGSYDLLVPGGVLLVRDQDNQRGREMMQWAGEHLALLDMRRIYLVARHGTPGKRAVPMLSAALVRPSTT
jgi:hypothetical protein